MEHVDIDDVDPIAMGASDLDRRGLSDPLDASDLAINYYALDPGEAFSGGLHTHLDQEELFYVVEGEATFEHKSEPTADSETVAVGPHEAVRFAPGEYQQGRNEGDDRVVALALGAPPNPEETRIPQPCPECDSDVLGVAIVDGEMGIECPDCGTAVEMGS